MTFLFLSLTVCHANFSQSARPGFSFTVGTTMTLRMHLKNYSFLHGVSTAGFSRHHGSITRGRRRFASGHSGGCLVGRQAAGASSPSICSGLQAFKRMMNDTDEERIAEPSAFTLFR
jgi:hypothetical protein